MNIKPIQYYTDDRSLLFKKRIDYAFGSYLERDVRKFKDKEFLVSSNYVDNKLICTLIYVKKAGEWIKSKLRYYKDGKCYKTLISDRNRNIWRNR